MPEWRSLLLAKEVRVHESHRGPVDYDMAPFPVGADPLLLQHLLAAQGQLVRARIAIQVQELLIQEVLEM
jgi:hypothetical protein